MAQLGTVRAAASRMFVTQPAISKQITRLETELAMKLFRRTSTGMMLTAEGKALLELGGDILTRFERAEGAMRTRFAGKPAFRVACPPTTAFMLVTPFMVYANPAIVDLMLLPAPDIDGTLEGDCDLGISTLPPPAHRRQMVLGSLPVTIQGSHRLMQARFGDASVGDLELVGECWALVPLTGVHIVVDEATTDFEPPLRVRNVATGFVAQALAANDHGFAVATEEDAFDLRTLPAYAGGHPIATTLYASWDPQHYASAELHRLARNFSRWLAIRGGL